MKKKKKQEGRGRGEEGVQGPKMGQQDLRILKEKQVQVRASLEKGHHEAHGVFAVGMAGIWKTLRSWE